MTYTCKHIKADRKAEWHALVAANVAGGFHQSFEWASFKNKDDWTTYKIGLFDEKDNLVGGLVALQFHFSDTNFIYIPEGPILNYKNEDELYLQWRVLETALHGIVDLEGEELTTHIRMEPRVDDVPEWLLLGWEKAPINLQPRHTEVLSLTPSADDLLAGMKQKGRYNIRLSEKKGVTVRKGKKADLETFYSLYKTTFTRNKFDGKSLEFFELLWSSMGKSIEIYVAEHEGQALASALLVHFGDRTTYLYGASSQEKKQVMAPYALHWHMIQAAKERGSIEYDFWGVADSPDNLTHDWHGITQFKKKFGGEQQDFIGAFDYVIARDKYDQFIQKHEA